MTKILKPNIKISMMYGAKRLSQMEQMLEEKQKKMNNFIQIEFELLMFFALDH